MLYFLHNWLVNLISTFSLFIHFSKTFRLKKSNFVSMIFSKKVGLLFRNTWMGNMNLHFLYCVLVKGLKFEVFCTNITMLIKWLIMHTDWFLLCKSAVKISIHIFLLVVISIRILFYRLFVHYRKLLTYSISEKLGFIVISSLALKVNIMHSLF